MRREHPLEPGRIERQRVAGHERRIRAPLARDREHRLALIDARDLPGQEPREEPRPAGEVDGPRRRQRAQRLAQARDVLVPPRPVPVHEQPRAEPPVVVLAARGARSTRASRRPSEQRPERAGVREQRVAQLDVVDRRGRVVEREQATPPSSCP